MLCIECGKENPEGSKFCIGCGARLSKRIAPKKKRHGCLIGIGSAIAVFVILMIIAVNTKTDTAIVAQTEGQTIVQTTITEREEVAIPITASKLAEEYESNSIAADGKYNGKLLEISGVIDSIGNDITGTAYFTLETKNGYIVQCMVSKDTEDDLIKFKKGDSIKAKKYCSGKLLSFIILDYKK
jgi:predicted nucleic acid-binding Zn ribbon protein